MEEELDYTLEASNQMVFADEFANDPDFVVPRVLGNSPRVLVTSWMESEASLAQVLKAGTPEHGAHFGQLYARFLVAGPTCPVLMHSSDKRRVGKECVRTCTSRGLTTHSK